MKRRSITQSSEKPLSSRKRRRFRFPFKAMGAPCEIQLIAGDHVWAESVATEIMADVKRLESRYSRYREDSLLSSINRIAAVGGDITVDDETASLLDYAATCFTESDGLFDITSGVLRQTWRFDQGGLPDQRRIEELLERIGWEKLCWQSPQLSFPVPGLELDFGGIVKEYAVDRAASLCREAGVNQGIVNLGGDVSLIGSRSDGRSWQIGITHPRRREAVLTTLSLRRGAVATSGDYERCILVDGVRYGHVLNCRTGWPVSYLASVSVVADLCVVAGSISTIAMLKENEGPGWLRELGLPHLWVSTTGEVGGSLLAS
jgi:thiamine biosynthesis lipoprotein